VTVRKLHPVADAQEIQDAIKQGKVVRRIGDYIVVHGKGRPKKKGKKK